MTTRTFQAGIHPPAFKERTMAREVMDIAMPEELVIPLHQHTGAPCGPLVKVGDEVLAGQKIGDSKSYVSAPVHASAAGVVKAIEPRLYFTGAQVSSVVVTVAKEQKMAPLPPGKRADDATPEDIRKAAREAGLVGMGGAAFPTAVKLSPPSDKPIDTVIVNGCECEPYLTCDHRNMLERPSEIIGGARLLMKAVGAKRCVLGIEANKSDALGLLGDAIKDETGMDVMALEVKYPQGAEKQLIKAVLDREVPPGKLPMEVGALVHNIATTIALYQAVTQGMPLIERVLTVTGPAVANPQNVRVKVGTSVRHILEQCGGAVNAAKVVLGGPMTGWAQSTLDVPVVKGTGGILALTPDLAGPDGHLACVRCGRCIKDCPMFLYPNFIGLYAEAHQWDKAESWGALDCFECGICAYVCPSRRPLVQFVRTAKAQITARRRSA